MRLCICFTEKTKCALIGVCAVNGTNTVSGQIITYCYMFPLHDCMRLLILTGQKCHIHVHNFQLYNKTQASNG